MIAAERQQRERVAEERFEAYRAWERHQRQDPRFATVRMLCDDLELHGRILPDTWQRVAVEERTLGAEILDTSHSHIDRFSFDGQDIIVKESDGLQPRITLRDVYTNGYEKTRQEVQAEPGLTFQLRRDELFLQFYEEIERMMRGETEPDTIHMVSTCPQPADVANDPEEAKRLLKLKYYDTERGKSFDYTARRLPTGELELSATTLDSSNLAAHAKVLTAHGYENVSFALLPSHELGNYLSYDTTTQTPIEVVIAARSSVYDAELEAQTGVRHRYGRQDEAIDAHDFFAEHCEDYWAGYTAYNELLARHLTGEKLSTTLQTYLLRCLEGQEAAGKSVVNQEDLERLRQQLWQGTITPDMAMACRDLLLYDHHATLTKLLHQFKETGRVEQMAYRDGEDMLATYAAQASSNGAEAAARGDTFSGCETATGVSGLQEAAQLAAAQGISPEEALRRLAQNEEEAWHCLRIKLYGFTIRRDVTCPFCKHTVDARETEAAIECLATQDCGVRLDKESGEVTYPQKTPESAPAQVMADPLPPKESVKLRNGQPYKLGDSYFSRSEELQIGGTRVVYLDSQGRRVTGQAALHLEQAIVATLAETPAA